MGRVALLGVMLAAGVACRDPATETAHAPPELAASSVRWPGSRAPDARSLAVRELARGRAFLAQQAFAGPSCADTEELGGDEPVVFDGQARVAACHADGVTDLGGDGEADCWRIEREVPDAWVEGRFDADPALVIWPGCNGEPARIRIERAGMNVVVPPARLRDPSTLTWLAARLVGAARVACVDGPSCGELAPQWQWILDGVTRVRDGHAMHGQVAPRWRPLGRSAAAVGALIVSHVGEDWMPPGPRDEPAPTIEAGPRILVDVSADVGLRVAFGCAGLAIRMAPGGVIGIDRERQRWAWLYRGFPVDRGFEVDDASCIDDIVLARTSLPFATVVAIDPRTGGWLEEPRSDCCAGAMVWRAPGGRVVWTRDSGEQLAFDDLRAWLALAPAARSPLAELVIAYRPELADPAAAARALDVSGALPQPTSATGMIGVATASIDPAVRRGMVATGACGGWTIYTSTTAILAERGARARWLHVEPIGRAAQLSDVTCAGGTVRARRMIAEDPLTRDWRRPAAHDLAEVLTIIPATGAWARQPQPSARDIADADAH